MSENREPGLGPSLGFAPIPKLSPSLKRDPIGLAPDSFDGSSTMTSHPKI